MDITERIKCMGDELEPYIVNQRRFFHRNPELSGREAGTQNAICQLLSLMDIPYTRVAETGIVATIKGTAPDAYDAQGNPRRRVALRADMDALPVAEQTEAPFASKNPGVMHACGHDTHMAMLIGAASMLSRMTDELHGEVRLLFQPAEEISIGSRKMMAAGALEGVDGIFGMHIWSEFATNTFSCAAGQRMANTDWFTINVQGVSAHGSMPHKGVDAIVVAAQLVVELQMVVSRDVSPFEPTVVTVGEFHGGQARNIMAGSAHLTGTIRTWTEASRRHVPELLKKIVEESAGAMGAKATFTWEEGNAGLSNDARSAARAQACVRKLFGEEALSSYEGTLAGEDFSEYLKRVPGVFVLLGTRSEALGAVHPQHSPFYRVDEGMLKKGAMLAAQYAVDFLAE